MLVYPPACLPVCLSVCGVAWHVASAAECVRIGPTGAGKTRLGVDLCKAVNGEVVNTDCMQMYEGQDLSTAKVGQARHAGAHGRGGA